MIDEYPDPPANAPLWWKMKKAGGVTAEVVLDKFNVRRPAIDVEKIAQGLGVDLRFVHEPGWSGAVRSEGVKAAIWVNKSESDERKRFTNAHELGHLFLHPPGLVFRDATFGGNQREAEANEFAADLLMPLWMLEPVAAQFRSTPKKLARMFGVSVAAISVRIGKLSGVL